MLYLFLLNYISFNFYEDNINWYSLIYIDFIVYTSMKWFDLGNFLGVGRDEFFSHYIGRNTKGKYYCTECSRAFLQKVHVENHLESFHFPGTFDYACKYCSESFPTRKKMYNHISKTHLI